MKASKLLEKDAKEVVERFPKLKLIYNSQHEMWLLEGELDICDKKGDYWETFKIAIIISKNYPYDIPIVLERSKIIPREKDRHISKEGICCLDIEHRLLQMSRRGIRLSDFVTNKVYPYFANQLYYNEKGHYAGEEYAHHFEGVKQFYAESLDIPEAKDAILFLERVISNQLPGRNDDCICGKKKFKHCHLESVEFLKSLGMDRLQKDIEGFKELLNR